MDVIACESATLVRALRNMGSVAKKSDHEIFACVAIEYGDGIVTVTATNKDQQISRRTAMETKGSGAIAVAADRLVAIASVMQPGAQLKMEIDDKALVLKSGRSRYTFPILDASILPRLPAPDADAPTIEVGDEFRRAFDGARHAVCTNEVEWYICGIALHVRDGTLEACANDGKRMAVWGIGNFDIPDKIIPTQAVDLILAADNDSAIEMSISNTVVWMSFGDETLIGTKVIDAKVQPYPRVMEFDPKLTMTIDRKAMMAALARLLIVADDKDRSVVMEIDSDGMEMSNVAGREELACSANGKLRIGFRAAHLKDALGAMSAEHVDFHMTSPTGPVRLSSSEQAGVMMIVMPYRIAAAGSTNVAEREIEHVS